MFEGILVNIAVFSSNNEGFSMGTKFNPLTPASSKATGSHRPNPEVTKIFTLLLLLCNQLSK